jgi:hypothetical protein
MIIWIYSRLFRNQTFVAGIISGFGAVITMLIFDFLYRAFGNIGLIITTLYLGVVYAFGMFKHRTIS